MRDNSLPHNQKQSSKKGKSGSDMSALHDLLMPLKKQLEEQKSKEHTPRKEVRPRTDAPVSDEASEAKAIRQDHIQQALDWLYQTFPQCFDRLNPKPLKRRIEKDIYPHLPEDQSISRLTLRRAIAFYTRWIKYRRALAQSTHRYDLQGNPVEEIQGAHKERAEDQLKEQAKRRAQTRPGNKRGKIPFGRQKRPHHGQKSEPPSGSSSS